MNEQGRGHGRCNRWRGAALRAPCRAAALPRPAPRTSNRTVEASLPVPSCTVCVRNAAPMVGSWSARHAVRACVCDEGGGGVGRVRSGGWSGRARAPRPPAHRAGREKRRPSTSPKRARRTVIELPAAEPHDQAGLAHCRVPQQHKLEGVDCASHAERRSPARRRCVLPRRRRCC